MDTEHNTSLTILIGLISYITMHLDLINEVLSFFIGVATLFIVLYKCYLIIKYQYKRLKQKKD